MQGLAKQKSAEWPSQTHSYMYDGGKLLTTTTISEGNIDEGEGIIHINIESDID